jgi:hypothetical protein
MLIIGQKYNISAEMSCKEKTILESKEILFAQRLFLEKIIL